MRLTTLTLVALMAAPATLSAQSFDDLAAVEVLPGWRMDNGDHMAALHITLQPGWITYWRAPGDAGIPPQFAFAGSAGIESIAPYWPTPEVVVDKGVRSIGYYDSVTVPLRISAAPGTAELALGGELLIGVCEEICIPVTLEFDTVLPAMGTDDPVIRTALAEMPHTATAGGVADVTCAIDPISDGIRLTANIAVAPTGASEFVVIEAGDPTVWVSEADVSRNAGQLQAVVDMVHPSGGPFAIDRSDLRLTVFGGDRAIDIQGCDAG